MNSTNLGKRVRLTILCVTAAILAGCGTTSKVKTTQAGGLQTIQKYSQVSVVDFSDKTPKKGTPEDPSTVQIGERMREHGRHFSDLIALELTKTKAFDKVNRVDKAEPGALVVGGDITRCVEGSSSMRFWIGMGAGSSYFDALVLLSDADTGQQLGQIVVDKNSWALGGGIASGQTVQSFMQGAAVKIADQVSKAKTGAGAGR